MALRNSFFIMSLFFAHLLHAEMVEVASKQSLLDLRYISADGKITYYQNHSGELLFATNYKVSSVLKSKSVKNTQYQVLVSPAREYALISQDEHMHDFLSIRKEMNLYLLKIGENTPQAVGSGIAPQLHLKDRWLSYYHPQKKQLIIKGIENPNREYQIGLSTNVNPYFIPQVVMTNDKNVFYTDMNKQGVMGILSYDLEKNTITPILKGTGPLERLEMCANDQQVFIGLFGLKKSSLGSAITVFSYPKGQFKDRQIIYESATNDIGNMKCQTPNVLFFVKNESPTNQDMELYSIAKLDFDLQKDEKAKITLLTTPDSHVQLVQMDEKVFVESLGKYFLLHGENNLGKDQWLKK